MKTTKSAQNTKDRRGDLSHVRLRGRPWQSVLMVGVALLNIAVLAVVFALGATRRVFSFANASLFATSIDPDTQLALLAVFNKAMDLLVSASLEYTAGVWTTWQMVAASNHGVFLDDLALGAELTKPWTAVAASWRRVQRRGLSAATGARLAVTLACSVCLTGLTVAINTIGVPKERWYDAAATAVPMTQLHGARFDAFWGRAAWAFPAAANDSGSSLYYNMQYALLSANALEALPQLRWGAATTPPGWQDLTTANPDQPEALLALDTRPHNDNESATSRGFAAQRAVVSDIFRVLQANGSAPARQSIGMSGNVTLAVPSVAVTCGAFRADEYLRVFNGQPWDGSVYTNVTLAEAAGGPAVIQVSLSPQNASGDSDGLGAFAGVSCRLAVQRMLVRTAAWIINNNGDLAAPDVSVTAYGLAVNDTGTPLPAAAVDTALAQLLGSGLSIVFGQWDTQVWGLDAGALLRQTARSVRFVRPDFASDAAALALVLAHTANHLLAVASWNYTHTADHLLEAELSHISWQLYASSPRLEWEWTVAIMPAFLILFLVAAVGLIARVRVAPGAWLTEPAGILVAASQSGPIRALADRVDVKDGGKALWLVQVRLRQAEAERVRLVGDEAVAECLDLHKDYGWTKKGGLDPVDTLAAASPSTTPQSLDPSLM